MRIIDLKPPRTGRVVSTPGRPGEITVKWHNCRREIISIRSLKRQYLGANQYILQADK